MSLLSLDSLLSPLVRERPRVQISPAAPLRYGMKNATIYLMKTIPIMLIILLSASCSSNSLDEDINKLVSEDYYLGSPGSRLFYRTTTKETQEKYHYSECQKKVFSGDQLLIESCVSSYWLRAKSIQ